MKKLALALIVSLVVPISGCGEKKNPPPPSDKAGVEVKAGGGSVEVKTPAADVEVKK